MSSSTLIVGHEAVRERLAHDPPSVTLIEGPSGVGKKLIAREAAQRLARPIDIIEVGRTVCTKRVNEERHTCQSSCEVTTARVADHIAERCRLRPSSPHRVIIFDAGLATQEAANSLLKILEEPPPKTLFILHASTVVLPTIASRASRLRVGPLPDEDVQALLEEWGVPSERAALAATLSAGRPGRAREVEAVLQHRGVVLQFLKAATEGDKILLSNATRSLLPNSDQDWEEQRRTGDTTRARSIVRLYAQALAEARTGQRRAFSPEETFGVENLPPHVLDRAIRRLGSPARSLMTARTATEILARAALAARRSS